MIVAGTGRRLAAMMVLVLTWVVVLAGLAHAQLSADAAALNAEMTRFLQAGKYAEAAAAGRRLLALAETSLGREHPTVGQMLSGLALVYQMQGNNAEAAPLYKRSIAIAEKTLGPSHADVGTALGKLADVYRDLKRYDEAEPLYKRSLAIREKALGPQHRDTATALNNMALMYSIQLRYAEAEPLYRRSLAIMEKSQGPGHLDTATVLDNLASMRQRQGHSAEAEVLFKRSLAIREKQLGPSHALVASSLNNLGEVYKSLGRETEAEALLKRSLAAGEKARGPDHPDNSQPLNNLAELYRQQARYAEAEPLYMRSLAILEKAGGPEQLGYPVVLSNLALQYQAQGRYAEAESLDRRSLAIKEKQLGPDHPDVGQSLNNLATLLELQGRASEAEPLFKRNIAIIEKTLGPDHPSIAAPVHNLADQYRQQGRAAEAEQLFRRSLAIWEKGGVPTAVAGGLDGLGQLYLDQARYQEAETLFKRSIALLEKATPGDPDLGLVLNNLAELYRVQGHDAEAEPLFRRGLAILQNAMGPDHLEVGKALNKLALIAIAQGDWRGAADDWTRSTDIIRHRAERGVAAARGAAYGDEASRASEQFWGLIKATYRLAAQRPDAKVAAEMFEMAQWAQSSDAAAALAQMAARSAASSPKLAGLARERQDLVGEWRVKDKLLIAAKSEAPAKRKAETERALADRLAAIDARLAEIDRTLARDFPDYAALTRLAPVSVSEIQAQLGADEALVLFLATDDRIKPLPEEGFVWVVTRSDVRWVRSELGTEALKREVAALRCGLDAFAWLGAGAKRCDALAPTSGKTMHPLPFDPARAYRLYMDLFGEVQDLVKGKHLLVVPSGALTQLPFHVLVTEPVGEAAKPSMRDTIARLFTFGRNDDEGAPASDRQGRSSIAWLVRSHAVTVLPAVASLRALRRVGTPSAGSRPMIGFGNPLLDGPDGSFADMAKLARERQSCGKPGRPLVTAAAARGAVVRMEDPGRGLAPQPYVLTSQPYVKTQVPLPETADELCAVAEDLKADPHDIRLGAQATEHEVKRLSASGELAQYRMLHFATHGALAGELDAEPGLILTPPDAASTEDDGYLSASEIAGLKLDADWVILSACNTAAGGSATAEALSGLARAFIYAQARALLVSHWSVNSDATVKLVTAAVYEMARDAKVGRAEALRRAMLTLIDKGAPHEAHPAFWAPFVVVGEGAAPQSWR